MLYNNVVRRLEVKNIGQKGATQALHIFNKAYEDGKPAKSIVLESYELILSHETWAINTKLKIWRILAHSIYSEYPNLKDYIDSLNIRKQEVIKVYLNQRELEKLFDNMLITSSTGQGFKAPKTDILKACIFSAFTGLRLSDLKAIKWEDIYDGSVNMVMQKTKKQVRVPLGHKAIKVLEMQGQGRSPGSKIFEFPDSELAIYRNINRWVAYNGIQKKVGVHTFRHSFAQNLYDKGVDIYAISNLLGHSTVEQTKAYIRPSDVHLASAISVLD